MKPTTVLSFALSALFLTSSFFSFAQTGELDNEVRFSENRGQWNSNVLYRLRFKNGALFLEKDKLTFTFIDGAAWEKIHDAHHGATPDSFAVKGQSWYVRFAGANPAVAVAGTQPFSYYENYFIGSNPDNWRPRVSVYAGVKYTNIYPGIDFVIEGKNNLLKYSFIVRPGGNVNNIKLIYEGLDSMMLAAGKLQYNTSFNTVYEEAPRSYQNGRLVASQFTLNGDEVGFKVTGRYVGNQPLVIDPTFVFGTYTGSLADNFGYTATYDNQGNFYTGGIARSAGYPTTPGAFQLTFGGGAIVGADFDQGYDADISITKYNPTGTALIYSTYLGGIINDQPHSLIVNSNNELLIYGRSNSSDFPTTVGAYDRTLNVTAFDFDAMDIIVSKFNQSGTALLGSTYIGGSADDGVNGVMSPRLYSTLKVNYADDARGEINLDNANNVYVTSSTKSSNFPVTPGAYQTAFGGIQDAVVFKFNSTLSTLVFSTFLGGTSDDAGYGIYVDNLNQPYVCGGTASTNFPTTAGALYTTYRGGVADGFITRLNATGTGLVASSFMGTTAYDQTHFVQLDANGNVFLTGQTAGNFPVTSGVYSNANSGQYIISLQPNLNAIRFSTRFGKGDGNPDLSPTAFLVDACNNIYFSGWGGVVNPNVDVNITGLPVTSDAMKPFTQTPAQNGGDFYFFILSANAQTLRYASYFGGDTSAEHVDGGTSRFDKNGVIYQAVCAGCGSHDDFPHTPGVWSQFNRSFNCNEGAAKIQFQLIGVGVEVLASPAASGCAPLTVTFDGQPVNVIDYNWDFGDNTTSMLPNPTHTFANPGIYDVRLIGTNSTTCQGLSFSDTSSVRITVLANPVANAGQDESICSGSSAFLIATGGGTYRWSTNQVTQSIVVSPSSDTTYRVTVTAANGCTASDAVDVEVRNSVSFQRSVSICSGDSVFAGGDFQNTSGVYTDTLIASNGCDSVLSTFLLVLADTTINVTTTICDGDSVFAGGGFQTQAGQYVDTLTAPNGCNSIIITDLTVLPNAATTLDPIICNGNSYFAGGALQTVSGTYYDTLAAANGCDSIITTNLTVLGTVPITVSNDTAICLGASVQLNASGGLFTYSWSPPNGLSDPNIPNPVATPQQTTSYVVTTQAQSDEAITNGDFSAGTTGFSSGYLLTNDLRPEGTYNVGSNPNAFHPGFNACGDHTTGTGNMMVINGSGTPGVSVWCQTINVVPHTDYAFSSWVTSVVAGSPAILQFSINGGLLGASFSAPSSTCIWQQFYATWNSGNNTSANICIVNQNTTLGGNDFAIDDISFAGLCPASDTVTITVLQPQTVTVDVAICNGDSFFVAGAYQTDAGTYFDTLTGANTCDSIVITNLTVNPTATTNVDVTICNEDSFFVGGANQNTSGIYFDTLSTAQGCDSVIVTTLTVLPLPVTTINAEICDGESYSAGGGLQTVSGTYFDTLTNAGGCDSIIITNLLVNPTAITNVDVTICNEDSFFVGGANQNTSGLYFDTLLTAKGCDSVIVTTLTVLPLPVTTINAEICDGESYSAGGGLQTVSGIYFDTLTSAFGCDSVVITNLTVNPTFVMNVDVTICNEDSFFVGGANQNTSGVYFDSLLTAKGCDSVIVTSLTVLPPVVTVIDTQVCDGTAYFAGGAYQTTSGTYFDTLKTSIACDSIVITNLIFSPALSLTFATSDASCFGVCDASITSNVMGGQSPLSFGWSNGGNTQQLSNLCAAVYAVTVTDVNGCTVSGSASVGEPSPLTATLTHRDIHCNCANPIVDHDICVIDFAGLPHGTILNEQYAASGIHISGDVLNSTTLDKVIVFNSNVSGSHDPDLQVHIGNLAILPQNLIDLNGDGLIDSPDDNSDGGKLVFTFDQPRDVISFKFVDKESPPGSATAYDAQGNVIKTVAIPPAGNGSVQTVVVNAQGVSRLVIDYSNDSGGVTAIELGCTIHCCDGLAAAHPSGGTPPYHYTWNNGATGDSLSNLCPGTYVVTVTDNNGCTFIDSVAIDDFEPIEINVEVQDLSENCSASANQLCELNFGNLPAGTRLNNQYAQYGIHISGDAYGNFADQVIVFDADASNTPDPDLETATGHLAIFPENLIDNNHDGLLDSPDDQGQGGKMTFTFDQDMEVISFVFVDKERNAPGTAKAYDKNNNLIKTVSIPNMGNGSVQTVMVNATGVRRLVFDYRDSGGLTKIVFGCQPVCCDGSASATVTGGNPPYTYEWSTGATTSSIDSLCPGSYSVTVTDADSCQSTQTFEIFDCSLTISGLTIVNIPSGDVAPLTNGMIINRDTLCSFSIRANLCNSPTGSVKFLLNGSQFGIENLAPYALAGDNGGAYHPWVAAAGDYTLVVIPYSEHNASGDEGRALTVQFTVTGSCAFKTAVDNIAAPEFNVHVYPVPFEDGFTVDLQVAESINGTLKITDMMGRELFQQTVDLIAGTNTFNIPFGNQIPEGVYFLEVKLKGESKIMKVIKD